MIELKPDNMIKVPQTIASARYRLPLIEQKIIWAISNHIKDNLTIKLNGQRLCEFCEFPKKEGLRYLINHSESLAKRTVSINTDDIFKVFNWVNSIEINKNNYEVIIKINEDIQPFYTFINEHYISGDRKALMSFKKEYTPRMYELLRFKTKFQNKVTRSFTKKEFLEAMGIDLKSQYATRMSNLKDKIISPSIQEINEKTDMEIFKVEYIRTGRSISDIEFSWRLKESTKKAKTRAKKKTAAAEPKKTVRLTKADKNPVEYEGFVWDLELDDKEKRRLKAKAMPECDACHGRGWVAYGVGKPTKKGNYKSYIQQECNCHEQTKFDFD